MSIFEKYLVVLKKISTNIFDQKSKSFFNSFFHFHSFFTLLLTFFFRRPNFFDKKYKSSSNLFFIKLILSFINNNLFKIEYQIHDFFKTIKKSFQKISKFINYFIEYIINNYSKSRFLSTPKFSLIKYLRIFSIKSLSFSYN